MAVWSKKTKLDAAELAYEQLSSSSDEELMSLLAQGNHDAMAPLFDRYQRVVLRVGMQILRDSTEAEDLLQSVFLELIGSAPKFDSSRGSVRVWIMQLAYHRGFNRRRYLSIRGANTVVEDDLPPIEGARQVHTPDSALIVDQALAHLSDSQRQTLELAFYEGMTMQEIAAKTGNSFAATRHNYYRGLEKLRIVLGHKEKPGERDAPGEARAYA